MRNKNYGQSLVLDIHNCEFKRETRKTLKLFYDVLCDGIDMEKGDLCFWDYHGYPKEYKKANRRLKGTSAVQFIMTSSIVLHVLDDMKTVYVDLFSCKPFNDKDVISFCLDWFGGKVVQEKSIKRK